MGAARKQARVEAGYDQGVDAATEEPLEKRRGRSQRKGRKKHWKRRGGERKERNGSEGLKKSKSMGQLRPDDSRRNSLSQKSSSTSALGTTKQVNFMLNNYGIDMEDEKTERTAEDSLKDYGSTAGPLWIDREKKAPKKNRGLLKRLKKLSKRLGGGGGKTANRDSDIWKPQRDAYAQQAQRDQKAPVLQKSRSAGELVGRSTLKPVLRTGVYQRIPTTSALRNAHERNGGIHASHRSLSLGEEEEFEHICGVFEEDDDSLTTEELKKKATYKRIVRDAMLDYHITRMDFSLNMLGCYRFEYKSFDILCEVPEPGKSHSGVLLSTSLNRTTEKIKDREDTKEEQSPMTVAKYLELNRSLRRKAEGAACLGTKDDNILLFYHSLASIKPPKYEEFEMDLVDFLDIALDLQGDLAH